MSESPKEGDIRLDVRHPLIKQAAELAGELTGSELMIVHPVASGWEQTHSGSRTGKKQAFCKLIQSTAEGAKHCRMCHILMTVAACDGGAAEQRCHAGVSVLVCPASGGSGESVAVLSSCIFSSSEAWEEVQARGNKLGIEPALFRKAFMNLPKLDEHQLRTLRSAMQIMSHAIQLVRQNRELSAQAGRLDETSDMASNLARFLKNPDWAKTPTRGGRKTPLLIRVVCELVRQRPDLPLTVKEVAAAARLTPNHFSMLFRKHAGAPFNEYLTEQRIARAKKLLRNPMLSINEVARLVGYDDSGYFTRRFHQKTELSPRKWRDRRVAG